MDIEVLNNIVSCKICSGQFNDGTKSPRVLSCGHTFCHSCLEKILAQNSRCFTCNAEIHFKETVSIPVNSLAETLISQIADTVGNSSQGSSSSPKCDNSFLNRYLTRKRQHSLEFGSGANYPRSYDFSSLRKRISLIKENREGQKDENSKIDDSINTLNQERKALAAEIKMEVSKLKIRVQHIKEQKCQKNSESEVKEEKLKPSQSLVSDAVGELDLSSLIHKYDNFIHNLKEQVLLLEPLRMIPTHFPITFESLKILSVFVVEGEGTNPILYGKVTAKNGQIFINSFQPEQPVGAFSIPFTELLSRFSGSSELPKKSFFLLTPKRAADNIGEDIEVIVETDEASQLNTKNFLYLCSALKGICYKGKSLGYGELDRHPYYKLEENSPSALNGNISDESRIPSKEGIVFTMKDNESTFGFALKDFPEDRGDFYIKTGIITSGLQKLRNINKEINGNNFGISLFIKECGLVI